VLAAAAALAALSLGSGAHAQSRNSIQLAEAAAPSELEEITVTARKRQESILNVPVVETAIPQERLERLQVTEMTDLPKIVPGLNLEISVGPVTNRLACFLNPCIVPPQHCHSANPPSGPPLQNESPTVRFID